MSWPRPYGFAFVRLCLAAFGVLLAACAPAQKLPVGAGEDWLAYGGTSDEQHFSALREINTDTVNRLGLVWSYDLPTSISSSGAPVAAGGVLYVPVGLSHVYALDARTGRALWTYDPEVAKANSAALKPAWGIRGIAYDSGHLYLGTQDGRLIKLDAKTGKPVWIVQTTKPDDGLYITGAPRVFKNKVIIGNGGADFANVRGYVTAYDAASGKQVWRFYTVPGNPADGFENDAMAMAAKTWTGEWWKLGGGGTPWNAITYDEALNRIYVGTGNGGPWNQKVRSPGGGDNLFLASIVALDADTGKYLWHYQETPGETWDFNSAMDIELAEVTIDGVARRIIMHAPKNGFFYVLDRDTGKLISAEPISKVNWASKIDLVTGRPVENPEARFINGPALVWPGSTGAHGPEAMAYNPIAGLAYIPTNHLPGLYADDTVELKHWKRVPGIVTGVKPFELPNLKDADDTPTGSLQAWNPVTQKRVWEIPMAFPNNSGVLTTAGNLVFQGQADGQFVARAADTGKALWSFDVQNGMKAQPITYSVRGRQYVTVVTGFSGASSAYGPLAAKMGWDYRDQRRRILTFALDGKAALPVPEPKVRGEILDPADFQIDAAKAKAGHILYYRNCMLCHGVEVIAGGAAPDLRMSPVPLSADGFRVVVKDGALQDQAMPRFEDFSAADLEAIRHYIRAQARRSIADNRGPP